MQTTTVDLPTARSGAEPTAKAIGAVPQWHQRFLTMLPAIRRHAELSFRNSGCELRQELVQETIARSLCDYLRLQERGREHVAQPGPLARYAVMQVKNGRKVGGCLNVRDVSSKHCQRRKGVRVLSLHDNQNDEQWAEMVTEDRHATPADTAAARVDLREWFFTLPTRTRELAQRLAAGETTQSAAQLFGISSGRVSQIRRELDRHWRDFQGEVLSPQRS